jgi:hypothetical protein
MEMGMVMQQVDAIIELNMVFVLDLVCRLGSV